MKEEYGKRINQKIKSFLTKLINMKIVSIEDIC